MSPTFTADDVGKSVESEAGETLGTVVAVDEETAYVEPATGTTDSTRAALDWEGDVDDSIPLADDSIREITDDAIRLEATFREESVAGAADENRSGEREAPAESPGSESTADADGSDLGSRTGTPDEPGPGMDDLDDAADDGTLTDASAEIDGDGERGTTPTDDPIEQFGDADDRDPAEELDSVESEGRRELEVDPTELTDDDPAAEIRPEEDVGDRTGGGTSPNDRGGHTDSRGSTMEGAGAGDADSETERDADEDGGEGTVTENRNQESDR